MQGRGRFKRRAERLTGRGLFAPSDGLAPDWQSRQPGAVSGFLAPQQGRKLLEVVPAFGANLVAHAPDFLQNLVFHSSLYHELVGRADHRRRKAFEC